MAKASSVMRMSGMNSGLDTESIVNSMTASTKLKITTNQRKVLKLQAQQEAYRSVIGKLKTFKDKYFNVLSGSSLTSVTNLNKFTATTSQDGVDKKLTGISVSAGAGAKEGNYSVEVLAAASQAKVTSASLNTRQSFNPDDYADGEKYTMSVTVGSSTKYISFNGTSDEEIINSVNEQLMSFGKTNDGTGIISLKDNGNGTFSFNATDKSSITTSKISKLSEQIELSAGFATGKNSLSVVIDGETKSISFSTIESNYFDEIFAKNGEPTDDEGFVFGADASKVALYKQVAQDMYNTQRHELYEEWRKNPDNSDYVSGAKSFNELSTEQKKLFETEISRRNDDRKSSHYSNGKDGVIDKLYTAYEKKCKEAGMSIWATEDSGNKYMHINEFEEYLNTKGINEDLFGGDLNSIDIKNIDFSDLTPAGKNIDFSSFGETIETTFTDKYDDYLGGAILTDKDKELFFSVGYKEEEAFNTNYYTDKTKYPDGVTAEEYIKNAVNSISPAEASKVFNQNAVKLNLENMTFADGTKLEVTVNYADENPNEITGFSVKAYTEAKDSKGKVIKDQYGVPEKIYKDLNVLADSTVSEFEVESSKTTASTVTNSTKLSDLGLTADDDGNYNFNINGHSFSFNGDATVKDMMNTVNASEAGVKMTFSSLSNKFEITSTKYGADAKVELEDGGEGLLNTLGFNSLAVSSAGSNLKLSINDEVVETSSNSYEVDGVTFTVASTATAGTKFDVEVKRDTQALKDLIKSFMTDYNQMISDVFGYVDEKPNKDYHFLTDDDKTEMELSDKQEEMWETVAKKGLLYNDSTVKDIMSKLRMSLLGTVTGANGDKFGLPNLGITTSSDFGEHGKLVFYNDSESKLDAALSANYEDIVKLFTDSENGIMQKLSKELESALKSSGPRNEKGVLVQKAGLATGSSTTDNAIYDQIKSLTTLISSLEDRYEKQQDRYWKIFGSLETQMGNLNSQTSSINQLMGM